MNARRVLLPVVLWLALAALPCFAQLYTHVTATVKDQAGAIYAGGSWQANLDTSGVPIGQSVTFQRTGTFQTAFSGQMDSFGKFSVTLPANDVISPVNTTQWAFKFCQHYTSQTQSPAPACFGLTLPITGASMDVTSQVQAASASLGPITPGLVGGNLLPTVDDSWNLGSASLRWADVYAYGATLANTGWLSWFDAGGQQQNLMRLDGSNNLTIQSPLALNLYAIGAGQNINLDPLGGGSTVITGPATVTGLLTLLGSVTGSAVQGTDSKLLTAGTISGTGSALCTDSNGGTTTSGCSPGAIGAKADLLSQTTAISPTTLLTPSAAGFYRMSGFVYIDSPTGSSTVQVSANFTIHGIVAGPTVFITASGSSGPGVSAGDKYIYADGGTNITYQASWGSGGSGDSYDFHVRLEKLQ